MNNRSPHASSNRLFRHALPLLTSSLFALIMLTGCNEEPPVVKEKTLPKVAVAPLHSLLLEQRFQRPAEVVSLNDATLSAELMASVEAIAVDTGDSVKQGDWLVKLDCQDPQNQLKQAEAQLAASNANARLSQSDLTRAKQLFAKNSVAKQDLDRRQNEHSRNQADQRNAEAALAIAENNVEKCTIYAPYSGVVLARHVSIGQLAQTGTALLRLVDGEALEVSAHLTAEEVATLASSPQVSFIQRQTSFPLQVIRITPAVDSQRRTQEVRLAFTGQKPLAGSAGDLMWQHPQPSLPAEYVSLRDGQSGVLYVNAADKAQQESHEVRFYPLENTHEGQPVPLTFDANLSANLTVITSGRFGVSVGDQVRLAPQ